MKKIFESLFKDPDDSRIRSTKNPKHKHHAAKSGKISASHKHAHKHNAAKHDASPMAH